MKRGPGIGFAVLAAGLIGLGLCGYLMPPEAKSGWWLNHPGTSDYREHVPSANTLPVLSVDDWRTGFRVALVLSWLGYAGLLLAISKSATHPRWLTGATVGLVLGFGLLSPPALSSDVYSYVADGRILFLHGKNPYAVTPNDLPPRSDPIKEVIDRGTPHPYGPVWEAIGCGAVGIVCNAGVWWQVAVLKVLQAGMLLAAAFAARWVSRIVKPELPDLTFPAVALNPLLVLESAGSGHNDMTMMALLLAGAGLVLRGNWLTGSAVLGLSAGVKFLPLALLPWLMIAAYRATGWKRAVLVPVAFLLPPVLCYLPFAHGAKLGDALGNNSSQTLPQEVRDREAANRQEIESAGVPSQLAAAMVVAWRNKIGLVLYAALTGFVLRSRWAAAWLEAWIGLAIALALLLTGRVFPWYFAWSLVVAVTTACRFRLPAAGLCSVMGMLLTWRYTQEW